MFRLLVVTAAAALALAACGDEVSVAGADQDSGPSGSASGGTPIELIEDPSKAPPLVVHTSRGDVHVLPGSWCWNSGTSAGCADMVAPQVGELEVVDGDDAITFTFPVKDWSFEASFSPVGGGTCADSYSVDAELLRDGEYALTPAGPAGDYEVDLFGTGPQGDAGGTFRWKTDVAGQLSTPTAEVSVVWSPHGELAGQGFSMSVASLAVRPDSAEVSITATAANGGSSTLVRQAEGNHCPSDDLFFTEERGQGWADAVAALGPAPFTYDVTLTLDGVAYHATAVWPDDHVDDPYDDNPAPVPLQFDPALPAAGGLTG